MALKILERLSNFLKNNYSSVAVIFLSSAAVSYYHYSVPPDFSAIHLAHYYAYYLIVIYAAYKFGLAGGIIVSLLMTLIYAPMAYFSIATGSVHHHHVPSIVEISMIYAVGIVSGYFSKKLKDEKKKVEIVSENMLALERQLAHDDRLRALGQLSAGIAHEIRNPLAAIKSGISMIKNGKGNPQVIDILESEIVRLDSFVNRFLQYAKFGKNVTETFSADTFMSELYELAKLSGAGKNVRISYENGIKGDVYGDSNSLKQALLNLILNGIDAVEDRPDGMVSFISEDKEGSFVFKVIDNGKGIPSDADKIFEPFFTTKDTGTGLGLAISSKIAAVHGGGISFESSPEGTVFTMTIKGAKNERTDNRG